jgi:nitroreductase
MKITFPKKAGAGILLLALLWIGLPAQDLKTIKLNPPDLKRGLPVMQALSMRASVRDWSPREISLQDLSDLLWAANGINRPESKKRTAASAMNAQDVDIYVFNKDGVYLYDAAAHALTPVAAGDHRPDIAMMRGGPGAKPPAAPGAKPEGAPPAKPEGKPGAPQAGPPATPPVQLVLVSDISRFRMGADDLKLGWAALDTGIVSQNIALFCAGTGLATRPRASVNKEKLKTLLKLKDTQHPLLEHPVGYPK